MATNGFFGKVKGFFSGKKDAPIGQISYQQAVGRSKRKVQSAPTAHGRKTTTGAFGGTGTGRGMRGMPGRKLIKKTVKAGWNAQNRVVLSTKPVNVQNHERAMKMTEQAIIREINGERA